MTCIVGIEANGNVIIGGDSAASTPLSMINAGRSKVFRKGPFLIGYSGSFRVGQVVEHLMSVPPHPAEAEDIDYMVGGFIEHMRYALKQCGVIDINNAVETSKGTMLIGYNGTLYEMDGDFQVLPREHAAIGSGWLPALGVLHYTSRFALDQSPEWQVEKALQAAEDINPFVKGPFNVDILEPEVGKADPLPPPPRSIHNWYGLKRS